MAGLEDVKLVEVSMTTLMKISKHCRESENNETMGVIMGSIGNESCFIGN